MRKLFLLLAFFIIEQISFSQKYFEGAIEYKISFQSFIPGITDNELKERFGTKLMFSYKDGSYIREYMDEADYTLHKLIYQAKNNLVYEINLFNPDTVFYYDAGQKLFDSFDIAAGEQETVLDCVCPSDVITYKYYEKLAMDTLQIKSEYYFCDQLPVNPDYYKNFYLWYDVIKNRKSIALKFTEETLGYFKIIYTAVKIDHADIPEKLFQIDNKFFLKKQSFDH